jgi:class 3 adenylate cyclase
MPLRNLHRRARPFRYFAYWSVALVCLLLAATARSSLQILVGLGFCLLWPVFVDRLQGARGAASTKSVAPADAAPANPAAAARLALRIHVAECALAGAVFAWVSLPPLAAVAAGLALLGSVTAQAGWQLLRAALPALLAGVGLGGLLAPVLTPASTVAADVTAALLSLTYVIALAEVSFRQAQRLYTRQRVEAGRAARFEGLSGRMEAYLAPTLRARLRAPVALPARRERRWLTIAFVDLVGFTELAARMEAESLEAVLDEFLGGAADLAARHGGEVAKVLGDGVLVAFGLDDNADRRALVASAARFSLDIGILLTSLRRRWRARGELIVLEMRAGIASGYCTVGDWGSAHQLDFTMIGSPVNLASRLQAHAAVDGVLLDATSAALAEGGFDLGETTLLQIKGLGQVAARSLAVMRVCAVAAP